ncbi:hypothetical protein [Paenibacillus kyungheensis]
MKNHSLNKLFLLRLLQDSKTIEGEVRLQKLVYKAKLFFKEEHPFIFDYLFEEFYFGPYSEELKIDLEKLLEAKLIKKENFEKYTVTKLAITNLEMFKELFEKLKIDEKFRQIIQENQRGEIHV